MSKSLQKGSSDIVGIIILVIIITILLASPKDPSKPPTFTNSNQVWSWTQGTTLTSIGSANARGGEAPSTSPSSSNYSSIISVSSGNAPYTYQSYEEYITIDNQSFSSIDITDWQLRNGKDKRSYSQGGSLQRFSADIALIPQGTILLSPSGNSLMQNIVLNGGERAIVTTGSIGANSPYRIMSFKESICTGYIESLSDYAFSPALSQNCPSPAKDSGVENLDSQCRNFINTLYSCRTPEFNAKTSNGATCNTCVNGEILSSSCTAFIREHYSYRGCVAYHKNDQNFSGRTWRIFLGRGWEMWAKDYETIELYDRLGQLVNFQNY
ncbi:MAG: hypothetical protein EXS69_00590 [Candidatus Zambryskibacteria bacterium]|nr:hypothetical protein [Candidatus Zambryskibacteria bacterium]